MNFIETLIAALVGSRLFAAETRMCAKCRMLTGEGFCDRAHFGEPGACVFETIPPCRKPGCSSRVACFGHPCELADRIAALRLAK